MFLITKPTELECLLLGEQNEIHPMMCHPRGFLSSPLCPFLLDIFLTIDLDRWQLANIGIGTKMGQTRRLLE
jgi:hypothetical protein